MYFSMPLIIKNKIRNEVECVGGIRRSVCVNHEISVTMICRYKNKVIIGEGSGYHPFYAMINGFNCFNGGLEITGMTYHIGVCKIETYEISGLMIDFGNDGV